MRNVNIFVGLSVTFCETIANGWCFYPPEDSGWSSPQLLNSQGWFFWARTIVLHFEWCCESDVGEKGLCSCLFGIVLDARIRSNWSRSLDLPVFDMASGELLRNCPRTEEVTFRVKHGCCIFCALLMAWVCWTVLTFWPRLLLYKPLCSRSGESIGRGIKVSSSNLSSSISSNTSKILFVAGLGDPTVGCMVLFAWLVSGPTASLQLSISLLDGVSKSLSTRPLITLFSFGL